jgi:hypothetical protein
MLQEVASVIRAGHHFLEQVEPASELVPPDLSETTS